MECIGRLGLTYIQCVRCAGMGELVGCDNLPIFSNYEATFWLSFAVILAIVMFLIVAILTKQFKVGKVCRV